MERTPVHVAVLAIVPDATTGDLASANVAIEAATDAGHKVVAQDLASSETEIRGALTRWINQTHNDVVIVVGDAKGLTKAALAPLVTEALPDFGDVWAARCSSKVVLVLPPAAKAAMTSIVVPKLDATRSDSIVRLLPRIARTGRKTGRNVVKRGDDDDFADPPTKPIEIEKLEQQIAMASADNPTRQVDIATLTRALVADEDDEELLRKPAVVKRPPPTPGKQTVSIPMAKAKTPALGVPIGSPPIVPKRATPALGIRTVTTGSIPKAPPQKLTAEPKTAPFQREAEPNTAPFAKTDGSTNVAKPPPAPANKPATTPEILTRPAPATGPVAKQAPATGPVAKQPPPAPATGPVPRQEISTGPVARQDVTAPMSPPPAPKPGTAPVPKQDLATGPVPKHELATGPTAPMSPPPAPKVVTKQPPQVKTPPLGAPITASPPPKPVLDQRRSTVPTPPLPSPTVRPSAQMAAVPDPTSTITTATPIEDAKPKWLDAPPDTIIDEIAPPPAPSFIEAKTTADVPAFLDAKTEPAVAPKKPVSQPAITPPSFESRTPPPAPKRESQPAIAHEVLVSREPSPETSGTVPLEELEAELEENTPRPTPISSIPGLPPTPPPSGPISSRMSAEMDAVDPLDEIAPNEAPIAPITSRATPLPVPDKRPPMPMGKLPVEPDAIVQPLSPRGVRADKTVITLRRGPSKGVIALLLLAAACAVVAAVVVVTHQPKQTAKLDAGVAAVEPPVADAAEQVAVAPPVDAEPDIEMDPVAPPKVNPTPTPTRPNGNPVVRPNGNPTPPNPTPNPNVRPTPTPPNPTPNPTPTPTPNEVRPIEPAKTPSGPPPEPGCDEVTCVLERYAKSCCARFKPADTGFDPKKTMPDRIDRTMVKDGITPMKPRVIACGEKASGVKGTVKLSISVAPDGNVTGVTVNESPDAALGDCVAGVLRKAAFGKTINGGTFVYPFVF